jgi:aminopeptidase N
MRLTSVICSCGAVLGLTVAANAQEIRPESFAVRHASLDLAVDFSATRLSGSITLEMENWTLRPAGSVSFVLNRLMEASQVWDGAGAALPYTQDVLRFRDSPKRQVTQLVVTLPQPIPPGGHTTVRIDYAGYLAPYTEVGWEYVQDHIDTAFTIIRSDAMAYPIVGGLSAEANGQLPYPDFTYDASVRVPSHYVVATGGTVTTSPNEDGTITWRYSSGKTSPFLNIAIAPFDTISAGGVRVFYFPADSMGARRLVNSAQAALQTLTQWFGPLRTKANLTITEIPDGWGSQGHPVGGIIQTASAFRDANSVGELYHELSHLWNAVDTDSPSPRWNEGLAMFLQNLMREDLDGWLGRKTYEGQRIESLKRQTAADSLLRVVPFIDYGKRGMTGRSYTVGSIMFGALFELLGPAEFNKVVGGYYQQFANGGTTRDFIAFAKRTSSRDVTAFFDDWVFTTRWTEVLSVATSTGEIAAHYRSSLTR